MHRRKLYPSLGPPTISEVHGCVASLVSLMFEDVSMGSRGEALSFGALARDAKRVHAGPEVH